MSARWRTPIDAALDHGRTAAIRDEEACHALRGQALREPGLTGDGVKAWPLANLHRA
jgi:hypothetical protein